MDPLGDKISLPKEVNNHLEKYWGLARRFFQEGDAALAAFFAITLIEEVGKIIILGNRDLSGTLDNRGYRNHEQKYALAVAMTLKVNARVTRVYGGHESRFAAWFRNKLLFRMRNAALYTELQGDSPQTPAQAIQATDAALLVCIAGEVYGEIQGTYTRTGPDNYMRIITEVDQFREKHQSLLGSA